MDSTHFWRKYRGSGHIDYWQEFAKPKIVYQEIQFYPSYCLDEDGLFSNNKTFILTSSDAALLAILNSPLMWWFNWRYLPHMKDEALSPMGFKMEGLPIARMKDATHETAADGAAALVKLTKAQMATSTTMFDWLRHSFGIEKPKGALADVTSLDAESFVGAVVSGLPKKRKPTAAEISELKREHATTVEPGRRSRAVICALERKLSELVNEAYGLNPTEIELMWRTAPPRMPLTPAGLSASAPLPDQAEDET